MIPNPSFPLTTADCVSFKKSLIDTNEGPSRFFSLELCGEAGELANFEKKAWKGRTVTEQDFAEEAADVAIALLNYANSKQIDLASEMEKKMSKIDAQRIDDQKDR